MSPPPRTGRSPRFWFALALVVAALVLLPVAQAAVFRVNEAAVFTAQLDAPDIGGEEGGFDSVFLVSGAVQVSGTTGGPMLAQGLRTEATWSADRVEVWRAGDQEALALDRPVYATDDGAVRAVAGVDVFWATPVLALEGGHPFGFSLAADVLGSLPLSGPLDTRGSEPYPPVLLTSGAGDAWSATVDMPLPGSGRSGNASQDGDPASNGTSDPNGASDTNGTSDSAGTSEGGTTGAQEDGDGSGAASGEDAGASWRRAHRDSITRLLPLGDDAAFTVNGASGEQTFSGSGWLIILGGHQAASWSAELNAFPLGSELDTTFGPGDAGAFSAGFSTEALSAFVTGAQGLGSLDLPDGSEDLPSEEEIRAAQEAGAHQEEHAGDGGGPSGSSNHGADADPNGPGGDEGTGGAEGEGRGDSGDSGDGGPRDGGSGPGGFGDDGGGGSDGFQLIDVNRFGALASMANGAIIGAPTGSMRMGGSAFMAANLTIVRFAQMSMAPGPDGSLALDGNAMMVFTNGQAHTAEGPAVLGPLGVPPLAWGLYIVALGAWLAARFWKWRDQDDALTNRLRVPALVTSVAMAVLAFVLFDFELRFLLGTSLFAALGGDAGGLSLGIIALVQVAMWGIGWTFVGYPVRVIGRSGLKVSGIGKPAYGFATGLGWLLAWLLGAAYIVPVLGRVIESVMGALPV